MDGGNAEAFQEQPGELDPRSGQEDEEGHFYSLYKEVLNLIQETRGVTDEQIEEALERIVESFHYNTGHRFMEVDYTSYDNVCGYLFRFSTQGAGLARFRVLQAAGTCQELMECMTTGETPLRVASLGGGPGSDALGFCSALAKVGFPNDRDLSITVFDTFEQWRDCHVSSLARGEGDFGDVSRLFRRDAATTDMTFQQQTLPDPELLLNDFDVIIVQRMLDTLELNSVPEVIENIHQAMKDDALVLLISVNLEEMGGQLVYHNPIEPFPFDGFDLLYLSPEDDPYQLQVRHERFGHRESGSTKARIAVLRKTP